MFVFDLAKELGKGVEEMMAIMTWHELTYWIAYTRIKNIESNKLR